ncbi:unnamed protein product [Ceratitis capitata]|uniref:(Mediterranean fruit fly) hypothetical protein n=1 Tax=Ceratitis capitata TaxID=7213 RepID=A0A811UFP6_CERCA|nr:unnamed protein product [Ceratitis capitata]
MFTKLLGTIKSKTNKETKDATKAKSLKVTKVKSCKCVPQNCKCKLRKAIKLFKQQRYHLISNGILL